MECMTSPKSKMDYFSARYNEKVEGVLKSFSGQESQCVREEILVTEAIEFLVS